MAYLYRHVRLDKQEVFYIGIGSDKNYKRAYIKKNRTKHWYNIAKNGYEVEIMLDNLTWEEACEKEKEFIKLYGRKDLNEGTLVNMTDGGEGALGRKHTNKTIEKFRDLAKNLVRDEEFKLKCGSGMRGKKHSNETKQKMSKSQKERNYAPLGSIHSEEYKNWLKQNNPMFNKDVVDKWKKTIANRTQEEKLKTTEKIKQSVFGRYSEEEINQRYKKMGDKMRGIKRPNTSNTMKGVKKEVSVCQYCNLTASKSAITRYHNENCKHKII